MINMVRWMLFTNRKVIGTLYFIFPSTAGVKNLSSKIAQGIQNQIHWGGRINLIYSPKENVHSCSSGNILNNSTTSTRSSLFSANWTYSHGFCAKLKGSWCSRIIRCYSGEEWFWAGLQTNFLSISLSHYFILKYQIGYFYLYGRCVQYFLKKSFTEGLNVGC